MNYGYGKRSSLSFDAAVEKVTAELKKEGFGVLTTIDMQKTLKEKINVDMSRYVILGACNPPFANQALAVEQEIGLLLPCNVIVYETENATMVSAFEPMTMMAVLDSPGMKPIAEEVQSKLHRVIDAV
jgi:uncharacterized protein (DUF302 family)